MDRNLHLIAFLLYLLAAIAVLGGFWFKSRKYTRWSTILLAIALTVLVLGMTMRGITGGVLPFSSLYEFLILLAGLISAMYLFLGRTMENEKAGAVVVPLLVMLYGYGLNGLGEVRPLVPALQSIWLQIHVAVAIIAYSFFTLSFAAALLSLWSREERGLALPFNPEKLIYITVKWGFTFMTLVLITGAVWAEEVWGSRWTWDPKETWALITWLIYAIYLHLYRSAKWSSRIRAWVAAAGFAAVVFTLLGVSFLLPGVHSYL